MTAESGPYPCWELLECEGEVPQSRSGHTCALYKNRFLYIFGGFDGSNCFDDLSVLDLDSRQWRRIEAGGERPSGRASHSAVTDDVAGVMYIFGGSGSHFGYTNKRDLCEFCFETECWRTLSDPVEDTPSSRYGQSMVAYQEGLYVWGGTHGTNYPTDMHRFDLCSKQWSYVVTDGELPCGRYRHQAMVNDNMMYIVGGSGINRYGDVFTFHFDTSQWRKLACTGTDLSDGRYAHSAVLRDNHIFLYGGNDGVRHDDLQQLDLQTHVWSRVAVHGQCPPGRDFHAAVLRRDSMVIFGGSNGIERHKDVFEFHMAPKIPLCTLSADFEALLEASQTEEKWQLSCDTLLLPDSGESHQHGVYCHAHVLRVRCPRLHELILEHRPPDTHLRSAVPVDVPHAILLDLLRYLYAETTKFGQLSPLKLYDLLLAARRLEVVRLAVLCERQIRVRLSLDDALPLLRMASAHQGPEALPVLEACKHFFLANYNRCTELTECEALDPRLLCELMRMHNSRAFAAVPPTPQTQPQQQQQQLQQRGVPLGGAQPAMPGVSPQVAATVPLPIPPVPPQAPLLPASCQVPVPPSSLASDLKRLLDEQIEPDFEVVVQNEVIPCHKVVLVARSRYFETCIITSGMVESQANRLVVDTGAPMTADAFRALLRCLYAGDDILGVLTPGTAMYLVDAASFYGLSNLRLKHFCENCVRDSFNEVHVLQLFKASSSLNVEAVRGMALEFIVTHFPTVCKQPALEELDHHLLVEILRGLGSRLSETQPGTLGPPVVPQSLG